MAWGSLDLRFKNDSPNGVFITAESGRTYIRVSMYGTKRYEIEAELRPAYRREAVQERHRHQCHVHAAVRRRTASGSSSRACSR